ncbi:MAG: DUF5615 family PIN-like protein [Planctomycetes bacterium]|nr:DUF5615 family PIN-like protein [Planctomycetota bacterium]
MIRLAEDENFNADVLRGVRRRLSAVDFVSVQEAGLNGALDPEVLEWAAGEGRVLFTHDASTLTHFAYERVKAGLSMPGVFQAGRAVPVGRAIEDILLLAECSREGEWEGQVRYLPL